MDGVSIKLILPHQAIVSCIIHRSKRSLLIKSRWRRGYPKIWHQTHVRYWNQKPVSYCYHLGITSESLSLFYGKVFITKTWTKFNPRVCFVGVFIASWECLLMMGMQHVLSFRSVTLLMILPQIRKVLSLQVLIQTLAYFCFGSLDLFDHGQGTLQSP